MLERWDGGPDVPVLVLALALRALLLGRLEFRAVSFCVGTLGWPTGCSGVGSGIGFVGASSESTGLVAVWLFCVINFG